MYRSGIFKGWQNSSIWAIKNIQAAISSKGTTAGYKMIILKHTLYILEIKREKKGYLKNAFSGSFKTQIKQYEKKIEALPKYYEVDDEEQNTKFSDGFYVSL